MMIKLFLSDNSSYLHYLNISGGVGVYQLRENNLIVFNFLHLLISAAVDFPPIYFHILNLKQPFFPKSTLSDYYNFKNKNVI